MVIFTSRKKEKMSYLTMGTSGETRLSSKRFIKEEGTKKNRQFRIFSIYLKDENLEDSLVPKSVLFSS
jgi:hypothetical protein